MTPNLALRDWFGEIDIYLFDQLLKGRFNPAMRVLDAGCGGGRNLVYFLRSGYQVFGVDQSREAVVHVRGLAKALAPHLPSDNFRVESIEELTFAANSFDLVISSAVLHFARDEEQWRNMLLEMWRVLKPGGIFFARLASNIGIESRVQLIEGRRYHLPDGSDRFLADEELLLSAAASLNAELFEPIKTVIVQNMRAMTTWCLLKNSDLLKA
jgi:SAM-dependent methyltransferase